MLSDFVYHSLKNTQKLSSLYHFWVNVAGRSCYFVNLEKRSGMESKCWSFSSSHTSDASWSFPWHKYNWSFINKGCHGCLAYAMKLSRLCSALLQSVWCRHLWNSIWIYGDEQNVSKLKECMKWWYVLLATWFGKYNFHRTNSKKFTNFLKNP